MTFPASRVGFAVHHARQGERVLMVVADRWRAVPQILTMLAHFGIRDGERIRRGILLEGFDTPSGGWIRFLDQRDVGTRATAGISAELVLVDVDVAWTDTLAARVLTHAAKIHADVEGSP